MLCSRVFSQLCVDPGLCLGPRLWSFIHCMFSLSPLPAMYHQLQILSLRCSPFLFTLFWRKFMRPIPANTSPGAPQAPTACSSSRIALVSYWFAIDGGFPSWLSHMFLFQDWWSCKRNPENHLKFLFSAAIFHRCFGPLRSVKIISGMEQTHVI